MLFDPEDIQHLHELFDAIDCIQNQRLDLSVRRFFPVFKDFIKTRYIAFNLLQGSSDWADFSSRGTNPHLILLINTFWRSLQVLFCR
ncbi:MAG: hypothetical protein RLZZ490_1554 [Cyanobacteriota bacterium]